jgi:hypothetical protein
LRVTYVTAVLVRKLRMETARGIARDGGGQAPFQDESKDHWAALTAAAPSGAGHPPVRSELIHHLHSPKYYPGTVHIRM